MHAVIARNTCPSQNIQNTPFSDHFQKLRCRKNARRCGEKCIQKSIYIKYHMFALLLEVEISKKYMSLSYKVYFEIKILKPPGFRPLLEIQMSLRFASLQYTTLHYTPLHYITLHSTTLHHTTLHSTTLQLQLHNYTTTLHYTPLH